MLLADFNAELLSFHLKIFEDIRLGNWINISQDIALVEEDFGGASLQNWRKENLKIYCSQILMRNYS